MKTFKAFIKAIKADVGKSEVTISFTMPLTDENLEQLQDLSSFVQAEAPAVALSIETQQQAMSVLLTSSMRK